MLIPYYGVKRGTGYGHNAIGYGEGLTLDDVVEKLTVKCIV